MESNIWSQLSESSRRTLYWAAALANIRAFDGKTTEAIAEINTFDIFLGMLLEHPRDAEPRILLEHFHLTPVQVLPVEYPKLSREAIELNMLHVSPEKAMQLDSYAAMALELGIKLGLSTGDSSVAELRALFAALLENTNPFNESLRNVLDGIGVNYDEVRQLTLQYVEKGGRGDFAKFLDSNYKFDPKPVGIPNYKADHGKEHSLSDDMVGIRSEVDAFAYLLASIGLKPPLAVGLFGDWGSGKSFFMESVHNRIDQLTQDPSVKNKPQAEVPFWKRIIQIQFNAWHYMEGELWASLVDHIFNQLSLKDEGDDIIKKRIKHWMEKLDHTHAKILKLESKRKAAVNSLNNKKNQAEMLRRQREFELEKLERLKTQATRNILVEENLSEVKKILEPFLISVGLPTAEEVSGKLEEAKKELKKGHRFFEAIWSDKKSRWLTFSFLVGIPLLVLVLQYFDFSNITAAFSGISATIAAAVALVGKAFNGVRSRINRLDDIEKKVNEETKEAREQIDLRIRESENAVKEAETKIQTIESDQQKLNEDLKDYQQQLSQITPVSVLTDFVAERVGSGDYRKFLGIPALIQQDFKQLSELIAQQNREILANKEGKLEQDDVTFNRIILYIDDLDRCPDEHVIKVLQAVHLLLAFDLFVVVVAVDSRWLSHALTKHFEALAISNNSGSATPDDYLEKIFQIPFWIQPLSLPSKRNMIQELLRGHLIMEESDANGTDTNSDLPKFGDEQLVVLNNINSATTPPTIQTTALSITRDELEFMDELTPILGATPRSTKRFVNLYQLVRIIYKLNPDTDKNNIPPDYELMAFSLALGEGLHRLGPKVLKEATHAGSGATFSSILANINHNINEQEYQRLNEWMMKHNNWGDISAERISETFKKINRFLFRVGVIEEK